jgi:hypothetical protein
MSPEADRSFYTRLHVSYPQEREVICNGRRHSKCVSESLSGSGHTFK